MKATSDRQGLADIDILEDWDWVDEQPEQKVSKRSTHPHEGNCDSLSQKTDAKYEILRVPAKRGEGKTARVIFNDSLEPNDWRKLRRDVIRSIQRGSRNWEFDLKRPRTLDSISLGELIHCRATIKKRSGKLGILTEFGSDVHRSIVLSNLHKLIPIDFHDRSAPAPTPSEA